jgi:hypothetical protein
MAGKGGPRLVEYGADQAGDNLVAAGLGEVEQALALGLDRL